MRRKRTLEQIYLSLSSVVIRLGWPAIGDPTTGLRRLDRGFCRLERRTRSSASSGRVLRCLHLPQSGSGCGIPLRISRRGDRTPNSVSRRGDGARRAECAESLECNWKVVMDAFQEGYHIQGVHPELVQVTDESKERYRFFGEHSVATLPSAQQIFRFLPQRSRSKRYGIYRLHSRQ